MAPAAVSVACESSKSISLSREQGAWLCVPMAYGLLWGHPQKEGAESVPAGGTQEEEARDCCVQFHCIEQASITFNILV